MREHNYIVFLFIIMALSCTRMGCFADPWPEPDPGDNDQASGDDPNDTDVDVDGDIDAGSDDTNDGSEGLDFRAPDEDRIFCSAPSAAGTVTVVGINGAIERGDTVIVIGENGQEIRLAPWEDGSFAGRIQATEAETLTFTIELAQDSATDPQLSEGITITAGTLVNNQYADNEIIGTGNYTAPDLENQVAIHGEGSLLATGYRVIGGNISQSNGRESLISCSAGCQFDLFIPAGPADEIDLFLVPVDQQSGTTDSQTVVVP